jgi:hypothetical protein
MNRIVLGRRTQVGGEDESILSIHGGMLFKPEMRFVIFDSPVRLQIPGKLFQVAFFIQLAIAAILSEGLKFPEKCQSTKI